MTDDDAATGDSKGGATGKAEPPRSLSQPTAPASSNIRSDITAGDNARPIITGPISAGKQSTINIINIGGILVFVPVLLLGILVLWYVWPTSDRSDRSQNTGATISNASDRSSKTTPATSEGSDKPAQASPKTGDGVIRQPEIRPAAGDGSDKQLNIHRSAASRIDKPSQPRPAMSNEFDGVPRTKLPAFIACIQGVPDRGFCLPNKTSAEPLCRTAGKNAESYVVKNVNSDGTLSYQPIGVGDDSVICECQLADQVKERCIKYVNE